MNSSRMLMVVTLLAVIMSLGCGGRTKYVRPETNLPISHEATLSEVVSPCEWLIIGSGIGEGKERHLDSLANIDARKAAIHYVLLGGTDPLLQTQDERSRFNFIKEDLFLPHVYRQFISWEASEYENRVLIERKKKLKIEKYFKINRCRIKDYLLAKSILEKKERFLLGMPLIAIIPMVGKDEDPLRLLIDNPDYNHAGTVIESHLTSQRFDVILPTQEDVIDNLINVTGYLKDTQTDNEYLVAQSIGSDIYIAFTIEIDGTNIGGANVRKATVTVKAYETTTARLLGSETGYSRSRPAASKALIEEALNDAIAKVISRIEGYWKEDMERGAQYKLHFALNRSMPKSQKQRVKLAVYDILKSRSKYIKPIISTENNFDYLIWVDPQDISDIIVLLQYLVSDMSIKAPGVNLEEVVSNRKLAIYNIN